MDAVKVIKNANTVVLNGVIDDDSAAQVCLAILELEAEGSDQITLMLNSSGGSISAGWMIADTVRMCDVETICIGQACSMGAIVLMAGKKGYRSILEHGRVLLHQPLASASMQQASDFELVARELSRTKEDLYSFICKCTGRSMSQVAEDCDRDHWLNAEEARLYGIVDTIESRKTRQQFAADCDRNHRLTTE